MTTPNTPEQRERYLLGLLAHLWTATGKNPSIAVRDLFSDDDPLVRDVEDAIGQHAQRTNDAARASTQGPV